MIHVLTNNSVQFVLALHNHNSVFSLKFMPKNTDVEVYKCFANSDPRDLIEYAQIVLQEFVVYADDVLNSASFRRNLSLENWYFMNLAVPIFC